MGFSLERALAALDATSFRGVEMAVDWLLEHSEPGTEARGPGQQQPLVEEGEPPAMGQVEGERPRPAERRRSAESEWEQRRPEVQRFSEAVPSLCGGDGVADAQAEREPEPVALTEADPELVICAICYSEVDGPSELGHASPPACGHLFHADCWAQWFTSRISDGLVVGIRCPSCPREVAPVEVKRVVSPELWAKFQRFAENAMLASDPTVRWCPKPGCATAMRGWERWPPPRDAKFRSRDACLVALSGGFVGAVLTAVHTALIRGNSGPVAVSNGISISGILRAQLENFCNGRALGGALAAVSSWIATREMSRHTGDVSPSPLWMRVLAVPSRQAVSLLCSGGDFNNTASVSIGVATPWWGKRSRCSKCATTICFDCLQPFHPGMRCEEVEEVQMAQWAMGRDARACPGCRAGIERTAGCNHMTCRCGHEFCWLCGEPYTRDHFSNGRCVQFGGAALDGGGDAALNGHDSAGRLAMARRRLWYPMQMCGVLWVGGPLRGVIFDAGMQLATAGYAEFRHAARSGTLHALALVLACLAAYWAFPGGRRSWQGRTVRWLGGREGGVTERKYIRSFPGLAGVLVGGGPIFGASFHGRGFALRAGALCLGLVWSLWLHSRSAWLGDEETRRPWVARAVDGVSRFALVLLPHTLTIWALHALRYGAGGLLRLLHRMLGSIWLPLPLFLCRAVLLLARGLSCVTVCAFTSAVVVCNFVVEMDAGSATLSLLEHVRGVGPNGGLNTFWRQNMLGFLRLFLLEAAEFTLYHEAGLAVAGEESLASDMVKHGYEGFEWLGIWLAVRHPSYAPIPSPELLVSSAVGMLAMHIGFAVLTSIPTAYGSQLRPVAAICLRTMQLLPLLAALVVCTVHEVDVRGSLGVQLPPVVLDSAKGDIDWGGIGWNASTASSPGHVEWLWGPWLGMLVLITIRLQTMKLLPLLAALAVVCTVQEMDVRNSLGVQLPPVVLDSAKGDIDWGGIGWNASTASSPGHVEWLWSWFRGSQAETFVVLEHWLEELAGVSRCEASCGEDWIAHNLWSSCTSTDAVAHNHVGVSAGATTVVVENPLLHNACWDSSVRADEVHWQLRLGGYTSLPQLVWNVPTAATLGSLGIPYSTALTLAQELRRQRQRAIVALKNFDHAEYKSQFDDLSFGPESWSVTWLWSLLFRGVVSIVCLLQLVVETRVGIASQLGRLRARVAPLSRRYLFGLCAVLMLGLTCGIGAWTSVSELGGAVLEQVHFVVDVAMIATLPLVLTGNSPIQFA